MRNSKWLLAAVVLLSVAFMTAAAQASAVSLPKTGQTKCYDSGNIEIACPGTGQDGEIQAGADWPDPRFAAGSAPEADCITDKLTGLMWAKNANLPNLSADSFWEEALNFVSTLNSSGGLCGHTDWRLPNINELESLVYTEAGSPYAWLNAQGFLNVQAAVYWSSTAAPASWEQAWTVDMVSGDVQDWQRWNFYGRYIWPVRSAQTGTAYPAEPWQTGQTKCYDPITAVEILCTNTGQDGELRTGAVWPDPRFTDNGNGTVTDNLTDLTWLKDADCIRTQYPAYDTKFTAGDGMVSWQMALDFVNGINSGTYPNCGGGLTGWRVPNRKELRSLVDYSKSSGLGPVLPSEHPFSNVNERYWSSTTNINTDITYGTNVWFINFTDAGYESTYYKYEDGRVWPVRSGSAPSQPNLTVEKSGAGSGTVTSSPVGISCGSSCSASFTSGTTVVLTAAAAADSIFTGWSGGGCSGTGACTVVMNADTTVTAAFDTVTYYVITASTGASGGSISPSGALSVASGTDQTFTITPDAGYHISNVSVDGSNVGAVSSYTFANVTANHMISAFFEADTHALTVAKSGAGSGTVTSSPAGISCGSSCGASFVSGTTVVLTAAASAGSIFTGWSGGGCSGTGACTVVINADISVIAVFDLAPTLTVTSPNGGESWKRGTTHPVTWTYTGDPGANVKIELLNGATSTIIVNSAPIGSNGSGSYPWSIPKTQPATSVYKIKVTSTTNSAYSDTSNSTFTIIR